MTARAPTIARLMCLATGQVLASRRTDTALELRVGRGRATHHRFDPRTGGHRITYGVKMVMEKGNPKQCGGWLSAREIRGRNYYGGQLSELNLLAHTCCHEFAHYLQSLQGQRYHGAVHNEAFYRILDRLHRDGPAQAVRRFLASEAGRLGLPLDETPIQPPSQAQLLSRFQPGDRVRFGPGHQGQIRRINRKTCTVEGTGPSEGLRFRVSPQLLERI